MTPEAKARVQIDELLQAAGWHVCNIDQVNLHAAQGVAIREFPLNPGHGFADYLLYVNGKACGVIEAKKEGVTLKGVEAQSERYAQGLPAVLPAWRRPLPFLFESTGVETQFTNGLDPNPRSRRVFAFYRPDLLAQWLQMLQMLPPVAGPQAANEAPSTFLARMRDMPELVTQWGQGGANYQLWPAQIKAVQNLEKSLAANKPKALIQMATGSGKTFTAISFIYRLIKFGGARRVLFLVDRGNLGRQTKKEFDQYASPYNSYKFGEEFIVQHLQGNQVDTSARVVICTIQRMFSLLKGKELPPEADEESTEGAESLFKDPEPIGYNPAFPIELFDIVVTDEAHRSIYNLWRQVLEYYDAYLVGLTATPNKQTFGFFNQNLVMEYGHTQAVADGVQLLQGGVSECRNKSLQLMFQLMGGGDKAGSGMDKIWAGWRAQHWRSPRLEESLQPDRVKLVLPMVSLISDEVDLALRQRFGNRFAQLDKTAVQAVVTAQVEGSVTNARRQEITGEHSKDITGVLQTLVRDGLLTQQNQRRWASYRVAGDSPQLGGDSPQFDRLAGLSAEVLALLPMAEPARKNKKLPVPQLKIVVRQLCAGRWLSTSGRLYRGLKFDHRCSFTDEIDIPDDHITSH